MMTYVKEILVGFYSLLAGMAVTIRYFIKPIVTVQYPRQKLEMTPSYRGHTELLIDPETGTHTCIACEMCVRICPSKLITLEGVKVEPKKKLPSKYVIEYQYCSLCGLCLESCPTNALKWSNEYRLANFRREDSIIDLLARLADQQRAAGLPVTPIPVAMAEPEVAEGAEAPEKKAPPKAAPKEAPAKPAPAEPAAETAPAETAPAEKAPKETPPAKAAPAKEVEE